MSVSMDSMISYLNVKKGFAKEQEDNWAERRTGFVCIQMIQPISLSPISYQTFK